MEKQKKSNFAWLYLKINSCQFWLILLDRIKDVQIGVPTHFAQTPGEDSTFFQVYVQPRFPSVGLQTDLCLWNRGLVNWNFQILN